MFRKSDAIFLSALGALAAFIWLRDLRWQDEIGDSLPVLAALPLFIWLRAPWRFRDEPWRLRRTPALIAAALFPIGIAVDSGLVLSVAWVALLGSWMAARVVARAGESDAKLLVLPLLAFPWMITDLDRVAWWFRISGAAAAGGIMEFCGFSVARAGTFLRVNDFSVSVEPACSGVNGLQSILVAGAALAWFRFRASPLFWWNLPVLVGAAWVANLLRILSATWAGALMTPEAAAKWVDPLHSFAGWLALCVVFVGCYGVFSLQERAALRGWRGLARLPWLELVLIAYAAWCARGLVQTWIWTPFDRFGWLAFALWILPVVFAPREMHRRALSARWRTVLLAGAVLALVMGTIADVNAFHHGALALLLGSLSRRAGYFLWLVGALAWMPAAGWLASRAGVDPGAFAVIRVLAAGAAAFWGWGVAYRWRPQATEPRDAGSPLIAGRTHHAR